MLFIYLQAPVAVCRYNEEMELESVISESPSSRAHGLIPTVIIEAILVMLDKDVTVQGIVSLTIFYCALFHCALFYCALFHCALFYCALLYCALF